MLHEIHQKFQALSHHATMELFVGILANRSDICKSSKSFAKFDTRNVGACGTLPAAATARSAGFLGWYRLRLLGSAGSNEGRLRPGAVEGDAAIGTSDNDLKHLYYASILSLTTKAASGIQVNYESPSL